MKQLIITGDDFGYSRTVNEAIIRARREGFLTSASLMPCGFDFEYAAEQARQTPKLSVGVHLCLLQGRAVLPHVEIPALTDADGNFHNNPFVFGLKLFVVPGVRRQIERELRAQMAKFLATGLRPAHINTHMHLHAHPVVFPIIAQLGREHGIRFLRVPRQNFRSLLLDRRFFARKLARGLFFWVLSAGLQAKIKRAGFRHPDAIYGLLQTGHLDETYLLRVLRQIGEGVTEIYFHPGADDDPILQRWQPDYDHAAETAALLSPRVKQLLQELGIQLIGFEGAIYPLATASGSAAVVPAKGAPPAGPRQTETGDSAS
ncbi:MAG: hopanoid biosynthesis-associated protein HpnK [Verrucomicrobia bacterium]|nr:hopanoid biosynthesis-associated protein HpnK [Verrucomicrobiota bacterium]MCX6908475.1 hopanoid biosynthesis-associated protein HpnK [Verrucomicrobiota bacterium]